ncbi:amidohydrolase [Candidatus Geothermarchaeota archaeon]|nr:MAG: amidohydrolase [Candidatus Geothermarchaeota archaeon]
MDSDIIIQEAKKLSEYIIERRRDFHMYPELAYEEERTSGIVKDELDKLGFKTYRVAKTGVIGELRKNADKTIALRADMDALPIQEENDVPYRSRVDGKMHACGHDAHTAMLLGAANIFAKYEDELNVNLKLIFQPAEEGGLGAKKVVEERVLDDVNAVFGLHVWAELESGLIGIREGSLMASADAFKVSVKGMGGHGAAPHEAIDPIAYAVDLVNIYQKIITREIDPLEPVVLSVTSIKAGTTFNVIPETLEMMGTIRTFNKDVRDYIVRRMKEITEKVSEAFRCDSKIEFMEEYIPPTINDAELADYARNVLKPLGRIVTPKPTMGAEDFSFYIEKAKGLYIVLGIRNEDKGIVYPHHHPKFNVDEDVLWMGSAIHAILAFEYK